MFLDAKNTWPILLIKILGFLTRTDILGLYCIKISSKTPVKILGYSIRTMFFDAKKKKKKKKTMAYFACQNLGIFKKTKILGLHFIKMSSKAPVKILGYFIRTMFLTPKNPWPTFACQNLGTFKKYKDIGLTSYRNLRFSTCQNLGLFHKNHVFWRQKAHGLFCLSKSWAFKENIDFGAYIVSKCQVKHLSKSWGIS